MPTQTLDRSEELGLFQALALLPTGSPERAAVRNQIAMSSIRLVYYFVNRFRRNGESEDDLIQSGFLGLLEAIERFDHTRGVVLSTYAGNWICRGIRSAIKYGRPEFDSDPELIEFAEAAPEDEDDLIDGKRIVAEILPGIDPRQSAILRLRFGLTDGRERSQREISEIFGIHQVRVSQIERKAICAVSVLAQLGAERGSRHESDL